MSLLEENYDDILVGPCGHTYFLTRFNTSEWYYVSQTHSSIKTVPVFFPNAHKYIPLAVDKFGRLWYNTTEGPGGIGYYEKQADPYRSLHYLKRKRYDSISFAQGLIYASQGGNLGGLFNWKTNNGSLENGEFSKVLPYNGVQASQIAPLFSTKLDKYVDNHISKEDKKKLGVDKLTMPSFLFAGLAKTG